MPRIRAPRLPERKPCPPHEWKDVSERAGYYLLRCDKCGQVYPSNERGYA
jgi:uncharacterized Zn finger protein